MDINQEITKHLEWIERIASLLGNEDITQDELQKITQHDKCALGQWLRSDSSRRYQNLVEFQSLIDSHDEFHKLAGHLISALRQGEEDEALKSEAQFIEMSQKVIGFLHLLQEKADADTDETK
jgi:hypothetical protein